MFERVPKFLNTIIRKDIVRFRPCIDLRNGRVVQIEGGSIGRREGPVTHFEAEGAAASFAGAYRADGLEGGHVIMLGPGNEKEALLALQAFPGGLHVGGGINPQNAPEYLEAGASHVIVTSYIFSGNQLDFGRLKSVNDAVGRGRLVLDLSCRLRDGRYHVVTNRWQTFTDLAVTAETLCELAEHCCEFLVHGVDVEGKRLGIEEPLVSLLARSPIPVTYAGGAGQLADLDRVKELGDGNVDLTIGSALDIFGGTVKYEDVVAWHRQQQTGD